MSQLKQNTEKGIRKQLLFLSCMTNYRKHKELCHYPRVGVSKNIFSRDQHLWRVISKPVGKGLCKL